MLKYSNEKCNINGCDGIHHSLFLCKEHYDKYIIDEKIHNIQSRIYKLHCSKLNIWDKLMLLIYNIIHYAATIHVYYVEHFFLESLFLYHFKRFYKLSLQEKKEFINDFDFIDNRDLLILKNVVESVDVVDEQIGFVTKHTSFKRFKITFGAIVLLFLVYLNILFFDIELPYIEYALHFFLTSLLLLIITYLGAKLAISNKDMIGVVLNKNLYKYKKHNNDYIKAIKTELVFIKNDYELNNTVMGFLMGYTLSFIILVLYYLKPADITISILIVIVLILIGVILFQGFMSFYYSKKLLTVICKVKSHDFKLDFYDLTENLGQGVFKQNIRNTVLYSFAVILFVYYLLFLFFNTSTNFIFVIIALTYFTISSFKALYAVLKINYKMKKQFVEEKNLELQKLNIGNSRDRIKNFEWVKKLRYNLIINWQLIRRFVYLIMGFLYTILQIVYADEIKTYIKCILT